MTRAAGYVGLCVGGPLAGQVREADSPVIVAPIPQPLPRTIESCPDFPVAIPRPEECRYRHEEIKGADGVIAAFWVPSDWPLARVFSELARCYSSVQYAEKLSRERPKVSR